ncbi:MAG: hypothetical protein ACRBBW_03020 [Cellvibrionaceae bacterium]
MLELNQRIKRNRLETLHLPMRASQAAVSQQGMMCCGRTPVDTLLDGKTT